MRISQSLIKIKNTKHNRDVVDSYIGIDNTFIEDKMLCFFVDNDELITSDIMINIIKDIRGS